MVAYSGPVLRVFTQIPPQYPTHLLFSFDHFNQDFISDSI